jgi:hypothetical protein
MQTAKVLTLALAGLNNSTSYRIHGKKYCKGCPYPERQKLADNFRENHYGRTNI